MNTSSLYSLDWQDAVKGLIVATGGAVAAAIENTVTAGSLSFNWHQIGVTALAAGISYLAKNFFTPAKAITTIQ